MIFKKINITTFEIHIYILRKNTQTYTVLNYLLTADSKATQTAVRRAQPSAALTVDETAALTAASKASRKAASRVGGKAASRADEKVEWTAMMPAIAMDDCQGKWRDGWKVAWKVLWWAEKKAVRKAGCKENSILRCKCQAAIREWDYQVSMFFNIHIKCQCEINKQICH